MIHLKEHLNNEKEDVQNVASTPVNSPIYPLTEIYFRDREYLNIVYETDKSFRKGCSRTLKSH